MHSLQYTLYAELIEMPTTNDIAEQGNEMPRSSAIISGSQAATSLPSSATEYSQTRPGVTSSRWSARLTQPTQGVYEGLQQ